MSPATNDDEAGDAAVVAGEADGEVEVEEGETAAGVGDGEGARGDGDGELDAGVGDDDGELSDGDGVGVGLDVTWGGWVLRDFEAASEIPTCAVHATRPSRTTPVAAFTPARARVRSTEPVGTVGAGDRPSL